MTGAMPCRHWVGSLRLALPANELLGYAQRRRFIGSGSSVAAVFGGRDSLARRGGRGARSGLHRLVTARSGSAHRFQAFGVGHQRGGLVIAQRTARRKRQRNCRGRYVVRHLGNDDNIVLAEREVGLQNPTAKSFDGPAYSIKTVLRIGDQPRQGFWYIARLG